MNSPKEVEDAQKQRLSKDEFNYCKKLAEHIEKMSAFTIEQRQKVIDYLKNDDKHKVIIKKFEKSPENLEIYEYIINQKICYIVFDLLGKEKPNFIPSGVIIEKMD